jgi:two-component system response regulator AtoC
MDATDLGVEPGGDEAYLVIKTDQRSSVLALPDGAIVTFGRSRGCTVHVDDHRVSRRHARIERHGSEIVVADLGSRNGTKVGAERVEGQRRLAGGDVVSVGPVTAVVALATRVEAVAPDQHRYIIADPGMAAVYEACRRVATIPLSVLVVGETGAGKENVAETIHRLSPRAHKPYSRLHLAALPEALLESELFGHERGAFTGADRRRQGYFESAAGGSLFLDEVGELPLPIQTKLLRALETKRVVRLGSTEELETDVRIIAATNRDLAAEVRAGRFREDLYFRLCGFRIDVPPLRERRIEIPLLAALFTREMAARLGTPPPTLTPAFLDALERHRWPGNVRELKHVIESAFVLAHPGEMTAQHLPASVREAPPAPVPPAPQIAGTEPLTASERKAIVTALEACAGNQTQAARHLGVSRRTLIYKMRKHHIRTVRGIS